MFVAQYFDLLLQCIALCCVVLSAFRTANLSLSLSCSCYFIECVRLKCCCANFCRNKNSGIAFRCFHSFHLNPYSFIYWYHWVNRIYSLSAFSWLSTHVVLYECCLCFYLFVLFQFCVVNRRFFLSMSALWLSNILWLNNVHFQSVCF